MTHLIHTHTRIHTRTHTHTLNLERGPPLGVMLLCLRQIEQMAKAICQLLVQRPSSSLDTGEKSRGLSQMEYIQCQHPILNPAQEDVNSRLYGLYTDTCAESFRSTGT